MPNEILPNETIPSKNVPSEIIAFIGLGNMGFPMASNLSRAGYTVNGFDTQITDELKEQSSAAPAIAIHEQLEPCVADAHVIFTMLPNGGIVHKVLQQLIDARSKPCTIVDCSTIDINDARAAHELAQQHGYTFFDAPVSGGIKGAAAGTLTAMVGGDESQLAQLADVLQPLFANIIHCGGAGNGQAAKICNNMLLATTMIGVGESFNLGDKLGLDPQILFNILSSSTGSCWSVNSYCPVPGVGPESPADNHYQPGFSGHMMLKDMKLTQAAAKSVSVATPLGEHSLALYEQFVAQGGGPQDFSAIIRFLNDKS